MYLVIVTGEKRWRNGSSEKVRIFLTRTSAVRSRDGLDLAPVLVSQIWVYPILPGTLPNA